VQFLIRGGLPQKLSGGPSEKAPADVAPNVITAAVNTLEMWRIALMRMCASVVVSSDVELRRFSHARNPPVNAGGLGRARSADQGEFATAPP
jgi:hypothetical protein